SPAQSGTLGLPAASARISARRARTRSLENWVAPQPINAQSAVSDITDGRNKRRASAVMSMAPRDDQPQMVLPRPSQLPHPIDYALPPSMSDPLTIHYHRDFDGMVS